jgi:antitoxin VapB
MSLNIKNERVHELVREASRRTGLSQTGVVQLALERMLRGLDDEAPSKVESDLRAILRDFDERLTPERRALLSSDDLYDEHGIPA